MTRDLGARVASALLVIATSAAAAGVAPAAAEAAPRRKVIDGIVAIVDDACVTRSELARFMAPHQARLERELASKPVERIAALAALRAESIRALVERRLIEKEAARRHLGVLDRDVDAALAAVAAQQGISLSELFAAAAEQGLDEPMYRAELRTQILEGKLLQLDASTRYDDWSRLTHDERVARMPRARAELLAELHERSFVEIRP